MPVVSQGWRGLGEQLIAEDSHDSQNSQDSQASQDSQDSQDSNSSQDSQFTEMISSAETVVVFSLLIMSTKQLLMKIEVWS